MNTLEQYRIDNSLTYQALADLVRGTKGNVHQHCRGLKRISDGAALRYHVYLGIPIRDLRPDLFEGPGPGMAA